MRDELAKVLAGLGLPDGMLVIDDSEARERDAAPGVAVHAPEALRLALEVFTGVRPGAGAPSSETPVAVVRDVPEAFDLSSDPTPEDVTGAIRRWLVEDPAARVVLLTPATLALEPYRFRPEEGEDPGTLWVFRIVTPRAYPGLWWAVVDPSGTNAPYVYGHS